MKAWFNVQAVLAVLAIVSFDLYVTSLVIWGTKLDPNLNAMIVTVLGTGCVVVAFQYFFGSSIGSAKKDDAIIKQGKEE